MNKRLPGHLKCLWSYIRSKQLFYFYTKYRSHSETFPNIKLISYRVVWRHLCHLANFHNSMSTAFGHFWNVMLKNYSSFLAGYSYSKNNTDSSYSTVLGLCESLQGVLPGSRGLCTLIEHSATVRNKATRSITWNRHTYSGIANRWRRVQRKLSSTSAQCVWNNEFSALESGCTKLARPQPRGIVRY